MDMMESAQSDRPSTRCVSVWDVSSIMGMGSVARLDRMMRVRLEETASGIDGEMMMIETEELRESVAIASEGLSIVVALRSEGIGGTSVISPITSALFFGICGVHGDEMDVGVVRLRPGTAVACGATGS